LAVATIIHSAIFRELLARLRLVQCRLVNLAAKTKLKFARFDFLRFGHLGFIGTQPMTVTR